MITIEYDFAKGTDLDEEERKLNEICREMIEEAERSKEELTDCLEERDQPEGSPKPREEFEMPQKASKPCRYRDRKVEKYYAELDSDEME